MLFSKQHVSLRQPAPHSRKSHIFFIRKHIIIQDITQVLLLCRWETSQAALDISLLAKERVQVFDARGIQSSEIILPKEKNSLSTSS